LGKGSFRMLIFDRWGRLMFETKDVNKGWDGSFKGKVVPQGVYTYLIEVTAAGKKYEKRGTVTVVR